MTDQISLQSNSHSSDIDNIAADYQALLNLSKDTQSNLAGTKKTLEKNIMWNGVLSLAQFNIAGTRAQLINVDIEEAWSEISQLNQLQQHDWEPLYDPLAADVPNNLADTTKYCFTEGELLELAKKVTSLRQAINYKADNFCSLDQEQHLLVDFEQLATVRVKRMHDMREKKLLAKENRRVEDVEAAIGTHRKKRRLYDLSTKERIDIVHACIVTLRAHEDVANEFRVTTNLISRLSCQVKADPSVIQRWKDKDVQKMHTRKALQVVALKLLDNRRFIPSVQVMKSTLMQDHAIKLSESTVARWMKQGLGLKYRKVYNMAPRTNHAKSVVLRQQSSKKLLEFMIAGKRIISIDESALSCGNFARRGFGMTRSKLMECPKPFSRRLSMICAMDTDGQIYFSVTHANVNAEVFGTFLFNFCQLLDYEDANWREHCVLTLDGASYHSDSRIREAYTALRCPVLFLGPYQYDGSGKFLNKFLIFTACEKIFSVIKVGDINPDGFGTGKKSLKELATIVGNALSRVSQQTVIRWWSNVVFHLYRHACQLRL